MNSFQDVSRHLDSLINYEADFPLGGSRGQPKLEPALRAAERLALPLELPRCAHIAGTVGKGSVAAMLESLLITKYSTLSFTSPHLISVKERVKLNGEQLEDALWRDGFSEITVRLSLDPPIKLTYFESVWVFYLWCAKTLKTQAHVVETGLGGSFDATNILTKSTAVFTKIHLDHTSILGKTPAEIARDKSGIIKQGCSVVSTVQSEEVFRVLEEKAAAMNAHVAAEGREFRIDSGNRFVYFANKREIGGLSWPLRGAFQAHNAATGIAAALVMDPELTDEEIRHALQDVKIDARQQSVRGFPNLWVDVSHNVASFAALAESLRSEKRYSKTVALIAMLKDKDAEASLAHLAGVVDEVLITDAASPRSRSAANLLDCADSVGLNARIVEREKGYDEMLALPGDVRGVVCGSFYLAGDFLRWLNARTA